MDTGIQANIKVGELLVNVYGPNGPEFDQNLAHVVANAETIKAAERTFKQEQPDALDLIQQELGGRVVEEYAAPPAPPQWTPQPAAYQPPPVQMAQPFVQPNVVNTYCQRCQQAPVCSTCSQPANPLPKSVKGGQYHIHECPTGDRAHKGQWCNPPK